MIVIMSIVHCVNKRKNGKKKDGKKKHRVQYFFSSDEALAWSEVCVDEIIDNINEIRKHPELVLAAKKAMTKNNIDIDQLQHDLKKSKNNILFQKLTEEYNQLLNMREQLGIFDFKAKKEADRRIQEIKKKKDEAGLAYDKEKKEISNKILQKEIELFDAKYIAYGCTGAIQYKEKNNIRAFFPEEYEIINEDIETYRDQAIIQIEHNKDLGKKRNAKQDEQEENEIEKQSNEENQSVFCRKCGEKLPGDSRFCNKCGTEIRKG